jgi:para-aminobenzoate synthetase component 1
MAAAFPMGSMTGAPKIKAMELIEQYEVTKRGLYSGAIGYFTPDNDFDFNVVIRTILYNEKNKYLSIQSGGAITIDSMAENEWDELNLKSQALAQILNQ